MNRTRVRTMSLAPLTLSAILFVVLSGALAQEDAAVEEEGPVEVGDEAPDFTLKDLDGEHCQLSEVLEEGIVLLDFGRFTCVPCQYTAVMLEELYGEYKDQGVVIYQVNLDGPRAESVVPAAREELGVTFPVLLDTDFEVAYGYGVETIPLLVLVDQEGVVRLVHVGYEEGLADQLRELFDELRPEQTDGADAASEATEARKLAMAPWPAKFSPNSLPICGRHIAGAWVDAA